MLRFALPPWAQQHMQPLQGIKEKDVYVIMIPDLTKERKEVAMTQSCFNTRGVAQQMTL